MLDEFRSPLHGILASAEFLRESELDSMQVEFISTIQNCGSTLLVGLLSRYKFCGLKISKDTINHVLDYSKINSFEKKGGNTGK
jgi:signal transduction histidine kinase